MRFRLHPLAPPFPGTGKGHGRKAKPGPCAKCGVEGPLLKGLCRRCYQHEIYVASRKHLSKAKEGNRPSEGSPAWVEDWLKRQVESYLWANASLMFHFDKNGTHLWAMTIDQILNLCRLIYLAKRHHNDKRGRHHPGDNYARREKLSEEGDGHYLDRHVMPEIKSWTK